MTWCHWVLAIVIGGPVVTVLLGFLALVGMFLLPDTWFVSWRPERACGQCGRYGPWVDRSSVGSFLCGNCAPPHLQPPHRATKTDTWRL